jgi:hypothetical protein
MAKQKNTPLDFMDHIYSLAYWMTGSETITTELVSKTYVNVGINTSKMELFKTFRACYFDMFNRDGAYCIPKFSCKPIESLGASILRQNADILLSVLLAEICGLKHRDISKIIGKPLGTIRLWLLKGRKLLANETVLHSNLFITGLRYTGQVAL